MSKESLSLMESFFFPSGIATVHGGIYNLGGFFKPFALFALDHTQLQNVFWSWEVQYLAWATQKSE